MKVRFIPVDKVLLLSFLLVCVYYIITTTMNNINISEMSYSISTTNLFLSFIKLNIKLNFPPNKYTIITITT